MLRPLSAPDLTFPPRDSRGFLLQRGDSVTDHFGARHVIEKAESDSCVILASGKRVASDSLRLDLIK